MASTLIGKFTGPRPNIDLVRAFTFQKWKLKGQMDVAAMPKGFFSFVFSNGEDLTKVLCDGPWMMGKSSLSLQKWSTNLDYNESSFISAPVWVRLPGLPLEYWHEDILVAIASSFGELLTIDPMTAVRSRQVFARIYVNIQQDTELPQVITLNSKVGKWRQEIEYEATPFVCVTCKKVGHCAKHCCLKFATEKKDHESKTSKKWEWRKKGETQNPPAQKTPSPNSEEMQEAPPKEKEDT